MIYFLVGKRQEVKPGDIIIFNNLHQSKTDCDLPYLLMVCINLDTNAGPISIFSSCQHVVLN